MTETAKTLTFVAVAVLSLGAAFMTRPGADDFDVQSVVGEKLNQFDVNEAKRLRIIGFDQDTASTREFEVAEENGLWVIPSKHGYPADAVRQMGAAATCLIDREVLRVAAESASQHAELGLVDPTSSKLDSNAAGVGTRVTITDIDGKPLTDMIIGKKVPDSTDQYNVRNADQDVSYVVKLAPEHLKTQFDEWIEKDLLGLNPLDIRRVLIKDYTADLVVTMQGLGVKWDRRSEMELRYHEADSKWTAERLQSFDAGKKAMVDFTLADDQEISEQALTELKYGLDDLAIVDVERKPSGFSADLKAGSDFLKDTEALTSLVERGFAPLETGSQGDLDILSTEGEIICTLEDGVEYVLRFGNLQMDNESGGADAQAAASADPNSDSDDGIHRYLFVMARFNENELKKPELKELPALPEDAGEKKQENAEDAESKPAETDDASEESEDEADEADAEPADADKEEDAEKPEVDVEMLIAERKMIEDENQRLLKEYQDKRAAAEERVKELNERFGDWYYVIDNNVFKQIHLGRNQVIKSKEKADEKADAENAASPAGLPGVPNLPANQ